MPVKKRNISFDSAGGESRVAGYIYTDEQVKPRMVLQLSHGMCEYIGRYDDFAAWLCGQGVAVCGNDHLGHGATAKTGTRGYFGKKDGRKYVLQDLHTMNQLAHREFAGLPLVLFGHSMGSFFARQYAVDWPDSIDGLILCGTGGPNPLAGVGRGLTALLAAARGPAYRSAFINNLAFGAYLKRIRDPKTPYDWITRDEEIVKKYAADPDCTFVFTVSAFHEMMTLLQGISGPAWAQKLKKETPVLLMAGDMDPVGGYGEGVKRVYGWLKRAGVRQLSLKLYPGARHELVNEINRSEVYADVARWLRQAVLKED